MSKFDSVIQSIQMIIKNLEENAEDCRACDAIYDLENIENDIEEHKEAIIALQMVASGKLRVI